jgi:Flp pilus assembly protein protease CpaA
MEREPLLTLLALYLLPCAVQDVRTRHVSKWLTIPAFVIAWPLALWLGTLPFTIAVFAGCYAAWRTGSMGPADGKLAVLLASVEPMGIVLATALAATAFPALRVTHCQQLCLPGVVLIEAGAMGLMLLHWIPS